MNRVTTWLATGLLLITTFLGALAAQEPAPKAAHGAAGYRGKGQGQAGRAGRVEGPGKKDEAEGKSTTDEEPV